MAARSRAGSAVVRCLGAAVVIAGSLALGTTAAHASPDPTKDGISNLAACYSQNGRMAVELVIDESASLKKHDADGTRVNLSQAISEAMAQIASVPIAGKPGHIDIRAVGFGSEVDESSGWHRLDRASADRFAEELEQFRKRDDEKGTDYVEALTRANADVVSHSAEMGGGDPSTVCRAVVWFTDGVFDLDINGRAPGWSQSTPIHSKADKARVIRKGQRLLCDPQGIADQLRSSEVYLLTAALLSKSFTPKQESLLRSITEGKGQCGAVPGEPSGRYFSDTDLDRLVREIVPSITKPPPTVQPGPCRAKQTCIRSFDVSAATVSVGLLVYPEGSGRLSLRAPSGDQLDLGPRKVTDRLDGALVTSRAAGTTRLVNIDLDRAGTRGIGTWQVRFTPAKDPAALTIWTSLRTGITLEPAGRSRWVRGREGAIRFRIVDSHGKPLAPEDIAKIDIAGRVTHGTKVIGPTPLEQVPGTSDVVLKATTDANEPAASAQVSVSGTVKLVTGEVTLVGARVTVPVAIPGAPQPPAALNLGVVTAKRSDARTEDHRQPVLPLTVRRNLIVHGSPDGDGTFCLAPVSRATAGGATVVIRPIGPKCLTVATGQTVQVPVRVHVAAPASGSFQGSLSSTVTSGITKDQTDIDIPVRGDMVVPPGDTWVDGRALWLYLFFGVAIPGAAWIAVSYWSSRFGSVSLIRAIKVPVTVRPSGSAYERPPLSRDDWTFLDPNGPRGASIDDLSIRAPIRVFRAQDAVVSRPGHLVHGPMGGAGRKSAKGRISHQIQGQWVFTVPDDVVVVDESSTITGELYFFVLDDALTLEAESGGLLDRAAQELLDGRNVLIKRLQTRSSGGTTSQGAPPDPKEPVTTGLM
ncbi:MAG: hypothetical protein U0P45_07860 [Acidimicrobiales bacterium]